MSRPLRFVPENSLVEITTRTIQGRLLLKPSPELTDIILGIIGKAQALYSAIVVAGEKAAHARLGCILAHGAKEALVGSPDAKGFPGETGQLLSWLWVLAHDLSE